jgi:translation initiation factor IF-2
MINKFKSLLPFINGKKLKINKYMASIKPVRLNKAAREFNVSTQTIVDFLAKKGFVIEAKPNTKLDPEMVELLEKEYHFDKILKQEINEKDETTKKTLETVTIEDIKEPQQEENEELFTPENKETEQQQSEPEMVEDKVDIEQEESELKISAEEKEKQSDVVEEAITNNEPEKVTEIVEAEKEDVEQDVISVEKDKDKEEKTESVTVEKEKVEIVGSVEQVENENDVVEKPSKEEPKVEKTSEEVVEKIVEEQKGDEQEQTVVSEHVEAEKSEDKKTEEEPESVDGPKILGKIDIDSLNQKTHPPKKTRAQKRQEAAERRKKEQQKKTESKQEKQTKETKEEFKTESNKNVKNKPEKQKQKSLVESDKPEEVKPQKEEVDENFIKTKYEKLSGPTVLGKMDLPDKTKPKKKAAKKPVASSKDVPAQKGKGKTRRPRIDKQKASKVDQNTHEKGKQVKKQSKKFVVKHEPSEEEIQKRMKETLARLQSSGKSKTSKHRRDKRAHMAEDARNKAMDESEKNVLKVTEFLTANELASLMDVNVIEVINKCMALGVVVSINQRLDAETIQIVAEEFGYKTKFVDVDEDVDEEETVEADREEDLTPRNPIVTVMGHVDHGKTKLLDYIRHANVVAGEAGGITQHIGAYEVKLPDGRKITFLDTPGHEAFTAMRARGAKVTDIAIIVIAADDAVMPQTKEAITHAQAAGVPIVFAFNKMDKPGANSDKIKEQLANMNILVEDWGGSYQSQEISAITGMGVDELLEKVLLEAEMLELKANPNKPAYGTVLEASLDKGRGYVANILVQNGTLRKGDILVAGPIYGKVKALYNERNKVIKEAGPSQPALLLGLTGAPQAGDLFKVYSDEKEARAIANKRQQLLREQTLRTKKHITLDEIGRRIAIGDFKELNLIVKGDVDGSVEALSDELLKLSTEEVQVNVIHKAVGAITETDVMLASASDAIIIGFMVRPVPQARRIAEKEQVDIKTYSIIYQAKEEIEDAIKGMLTRKTVEKIVCNLEVRETFKVSKVGTVAGCYVLDGKISRNTKIRLIRDGIVVYTGNLGSLKRFKDDVKEVSAGYECGLNIENFNDIKVGDIIEGYEIVEV